MGDTSSEILEKALSKARVAGGGRRGKKSDAIERLADEIVAELDEPGRSGSSRTSSGLSHDGSDVDLMSYKLVNALPTAIQGSDTSSTGEGEGVLAQQLVPTALEISSSEKDSDYEGWVEGMVQKSCVDGQEEVRSARSSIAEQLVQQATTIAETNLSSQTELASDLINGAIANAVELPSTGSSFAQTIVGEMAIQAEEKELSKSPTG